jgi:hypothetical protein
MRNSWIGILAAAGILAGCGGGGGGSHGAAPQESGQLAAPASYQSAMPTVGDYYTWEYVSREQGASADSYSYTTRLVREVAQDGAISAAYLYDYINSSTPLTYASGTNKVNFDGLGHWLGTSNAACTATPNPPHYPVAPRAVQAGMSWQSSGTIQTQCTLAPAAQRTFDYKDKMFGMEQVSVPAGIFNALKVVRNGVEEDGNQRRVAEQTCWWEPELGIDVKCVTNFTITDKTTGETRTRVDTESMLGYSNQRVARKADTELRFMGNWSGRYDGVALGRNVSGLCSLMFDGGNITGSCTGPDVVFNITGKVWADGALVFTAANNGNVALTFTGKFDNLQQMSGSWGVPAYGSGSWAMTQD